MQKTGQKIIAFLIVLCFLVSLSSAVDICEQSYTIGRMNQTINLTEGPMGAMNQTINLTANMTAGPKGDNGANGAKGDPGPNIVSSGVTATDITGILKGDGSFAYVAVPDVDYSTMENVSRTNNTNIWNTSQWFALKTSVPDIQPFAANDTLYAANVTAFAANFSQSFVPYSNFSYVTTFNATYILDYGYRIFRSNVDHGAWRIANLTTTAANPMDAANVSFVNNNLTWTNNSQTTNTSMYYVRGGIARLSAVQLIYGTGATAITGLSFPIAAFETVQFNSQIIFGSMSLNGTSFSITIPSGAINASLFCPVVKTGAPSTFNSSLIVSSATATWESCNHEANQRGWVQMSGTVQNAATAGTVQFNIQNKRASTLTVNASSYVTWNRMKSYTAGGAK